VYRYSCHIVIALQYEERYNLKEMPLPFNTVYNPLTWIDLENCVTGTLCEQEREKIFTVTFKTQ